MDDLFEGLFELIGHCFKGMFSSWKATLITLSIVVLIILGVVYL